MTIKEAREIRKKIEELAKNLSDAEAVDYPVLYPEWNAQESYQVGDKVRENGILYKCLQAHKAQADWNPSQAVSLWARVINEGDGGAVPEFVQPDSTNPYMKGDKVSFEGQVYECLINNCTWNPTDYPAAWRVVT